LSRAGAGAVAATLLLGLAAAPARGEEWRQRDRWQRPAEVMDVLGVTRGRHAIPADLVRSDAERQGFRFVREAPGFNRPRGGGEAWYYLVFEKAAAATSSSRTSGRPS